MGWRIACCAGFLVVAPARAEVVHLQDGSVLVGSVSAAADADAREWSVATLDGMRRIARDDVAGIDACEAQRKDLKAAAHGDWKEALRRCDDAMALGLWDEVLLLADHALVKVARDPQRPRFELPPRFLDLPVLGVAPGASLDEATAAALLRAAGDDQRPATALVARHRAKQLEPGAPLDAAALQALEDDHHAVRRAAIEVLGRSRPEQALEPLLGRLLFDRDPDVRRDAIEAVRSYQHDRVVYPVVRALQTEDAALREAAMDAVEAMHLTRAAGALIRNLQRRQDAGGKTRGHLSSITHTSYVSDFDVEIAQAAVIGQPIVKVAQSGVVQDVGVIGTFARSGPSLAERTRIGRLLGKLTGQSFGTDASSWAEWLARQ